MAKKYLFFQIVIIITLTTTLFLGCAPFANEESENITINIVYNTRGGEEIDSKPMQWKRYSTWLQLTPEYVPLSPKYEGYIFLGWYVRVGTSDKKIKISTDGTNVFYTLDGKEQFRIDFYNSGEYVDGFHDGSRVHMIAEWAKVINVTFKDNDKTLDSVSLAEGVETNLPTADSLGISKYGYGFKGWSKAASSSVITYYNGGTITPDEDITLYAIYAEGKSATPNNVKEVIRSLTTNETVVISGSLDKEINYSNTNNYETYFIGNIQKALNDVSGIFITLDLEGCENLTNINGLKSGNLKKILLPKGLKKIGNYAFKDCINLEEVTIPNTLTTLGSAAFYGCEKLTGEITIPYSVIKIGVNSFYGASITSVKFEKTTGWYKTKNSSVWDAMAGGTSIPTSEMRDDQTALKYLTTASLYEYYLYNGYQ